VLADQRALPSSERVLCAPVTTQAEAAVHSRGLLRASYRKATRCPRTSLAAQRAGELRPNRAGRGVRTGVV
jgi:hypothetical protein